MQIKGCVSFLDNTDAGLLLVLLLLLLFANAFFSLIETALTEATAAASRSSLKMVTATQRRHSVCSRTQKRRFPSSRSASR